MAKRRLWVAGSLALLLVAPAAVAQSGPPTLAERSVVHIESSRPVQLERRPPGEVDWAFACHDPCDEAVSTQGDFRITGDDVRTSRPFVLRARAGDAPIVLHVRPHSRHVRTAGWVALVGGFVVADMALVLYEVAVWDAGLNGVLGSFACAGGRASQTCSQPATQPSAAPYVATAAVALGVAVAGIVAVVATPVTSVASANAEALEEKRPAPRPRIEPEPVDHAYDAATLRPPPTLTFPVLRLTF